MSCFKIEKSIHTGTYTDQLKCNFWVNQMTTPWKYVYKRQIKLSTLFGILSCNFSQLWAFLLIRLCAKISKLLSVKYCNWLGNDHETQSKMQHFKGDFGRIPPTHKPNECVSFRWFVSEVKMANLHALQIIQMMLSSLKCLSSSNLFKHSSTKYISTLIEVIGLTASINENSY